LIGRKVELLARELEQSLPRIHSESTVAPVKLFTSWTHWTS
jgi:hypothetical protein